MPIRHLTILGPLLAVALSALGCGGDGPPAGNAVRPDGVATTVLTVAGEDVEIGASGAAGGRPDGSVAYPVDLLVERIAMPPALLETLDGEAINDTLRNGIEGATGETRRDATATWRGRLAAHEPDAGAEPAGKLLTGNAGITARLEPTAPDARTATGADHLSLVDLALTDLTRASCEAARLHELTWSSLELMAAAPDTAAVTFHENSEISGLFDDGGGDVMGRFDKEAVAGVLRAAQRGGMVDAGIAGR